MRKILLWDEIPEDKKVTKEFLMTCRGAKGPDGENWVKNCLEGYGCKAAVPFFGRKDLFKICGNKVLPGEEFCCKHGGAKNVRRIEDAKKRIEKLRSNINRCKYNIEILQKEIDIYEKEIELLQAKNQLK